MNADTKILWGEGLFLRPQHFQQQDAYLESLVRQAMLAAQPYCWGIRTLDIDHDALSSGMLRLHRAELVFADGEPYCAPGKDLLPEPIALARAVFTDGVAEFYLAVRHLQDHGSNCAGPDSTLALTRYAIAPSTIRDRYTDAIEAEITTLKKRAQLRSNNEPLDPYACLPIARIRRTATGSYECDPDFIAPSLQIGSSGLLTRLLQRLLDALQAKSQALCGLHREPSRSVVEFRSGDVASFWLLHTVNSAFAALAHLRHAPLIHPERLFHELLRLAGGLMTFSKLHELADLPAYHHANPGPGFNQLEGILRTLLDTVISTRYFTIALAETRSAFHSGRLDSGRIGPDTAFYLAVSSSIPLAELIESVPLRIKIGAPDDVDKLVLSALSGVSLTHAAQVPAAIPVRPGSCYFAIDRGGALYERMLKAQTISIYAPASYSDLKLELIALTP